MKFEEKLLKDREREGRGREGVVYTITGLEEKQEKAEGWGKSLVDEFSDLVRLPILNPTPIGNNGGCLIYLGKFTPTPFQYL